MNTSISEVQKHRIQLVYVYLGFYKILLMTLSVSYVIRDTWFVTSVI